MFIGEKYRKNEDFFINQDQIGLISYNKKFINIFVKCQISEAIYSEEMKNYYKVSV